MDHVSVSLEVMCQLAGSLEQVVCHSVGPQSLHTLLTSSTGKMMITNNGECLLSALHLSHPIAKYIVTSLQNMYREAGDGSKMFIILVTSLLRELRSLVERQHKGTRTIGHDLAINRTRLRIMLDYLLMDLRGNIYTTTRPFCDLNGTKNFSQNAFVNIKKYLASHFDTHYNKKVSDHFAELLLSSITNSDNFTDIDEWTMQRMVENVDIVLDNFKFVCVKSPGYLYEKSVTLTGILLDGDLVALAEMKTSTSSSMVMINGSIDNPSSPNEVTVDITDTLQLHRAMDLKLKRATLFINKCVDNDVALIACSQDISDFVLQLCETNNISVIKYVSEEHMQACELIVKKLAIENTTEDILFQNLVKISSFQSVTIGNRRYAHVTPCRSQWKHLVISAPTEGLTSQLERSIINALKSIQLTMKEYMVSKFRTRNRLENDVGSTHSDSHPPNIIPPNAIHISSHSNHNSTDLKEVSSKDELYSEGEFEENVTMLSEISKCFTKGGGYFEYMIYQRCMQNYDASNDQELKQIYKSVAKAVLQIPLALKKAQSSVTKLPTLSPHNMFKVTPSCDCVRECACHLDSIFVKEHVLNCAIETVRNLLRIDSIIGGKRK